MLREQMNDLAAEVVNLTAMLEGPDFADRQGAGRARRACEDQSTIWARL